MPIPDPIWPTDATAAIAIQHELAAKVRLIDDFTDAKPPNLIAGVDVAYDLKSNLSHAVVVTMRLDRLQPLEIIRAELPTEFPYIPGLLSFREIPVLLKALAKLRGKPDLLMVDGQGVAHPRGLGIAAHLGVLTDTPAIGVAKSRLCGKFDDPAITKGSQSPLMYHGKQIGTVLRSKDKTNPLFISAGQRISQATALAFVLRCLVKHRLPEPTRIADKYSKRRDEAARLL